MTTDYAAQAEQHRNAHERDLQRIRDRFQRKEITAELRDTLIARNLLDTKDKLQQLRDAERIERSQRRQTLEQRLFAPTVKDGSDAATRSTAYRQARTEAAKLGDQGAIREALRQAIRSDDRLMQKAIFEHAHDVSTSTGDKGLANVVISYINEVQPTAAEPYVELVQLVRDDKSLGSRLHREAAYLLPTPNEVARYQEHRLPHIADDPRFGDAA